MCWIIQKLQNCIFEWSKEPKKRFLAIFWSLIWKKRAKLAFFWRIFIFGWTWLLNRLGHMFSKSFSQPRAGPTGGYSENSHFTVQNIQKSGYFWQFFKFCRISRNIYQMLTPENESSNLHLTHRENRKSDASSILKILPVKGVLFSTSVLSFSWATTWESSPSVRVCVCVCPQFSRVTAPRILPKLGQKLQGDEWGTVTRPVFPGKI